MSEYDCVGVTSEYLDSLKNKIIKLEQQKAELIEFIKDIVDYEAERVLREREILLNKYKQQEVRDDSR